MNLDWRDIKGEIDPSGYGPGTHHVRMGECKFDETPSGKTYLQINFDKDSYKRDDGRPFTSCRLYFSSEVPVKISRHHLHKLCDKLGVAYSPARVETGEAILDLGREMYGRELDIELVPTGEKNDKGNDYLGVHIDEVGDLFIKAKTETNDLSTSVDEALGINEGNDSDIPF